MKTNAIHYEEEHAMLRDEARRWLAEHCPVSEVRRLAVDARGDDPRHWKSLAEMGWTGLLVSESYGGAGLGPVAAAVVLEESGRALLPSPLLPTLLASAVLQQAGSPTQRERWLSPLAAGDAVATFAHVGGEGHFEPHETPLVLDADGRLHGELHHVWGGAVADLVVAPARTPDGVRFVCFGRELVEVSPEVGLDPSRRQARLSIARHLDPDAALPARVEEVWPSLLALFLTTVSAEMAGGADALLRMTAEYTATREQFGRQIGAFQAIKHPLVDVLIGVEQLRSLVYAAASACEQGAGDALDLARMAKAQASDVYPFAASRAVQFHGGYGFTEECDAHLYLRRAQCTRPAFGDARHHRAHIAAGLLDASDAAQREA